MIACLEADASKRPSFGVLQDKLKLLRPEDISANLMSRRDGVEALLADIFPPCIARALKEGRQVETENWDMVTILFSDIVGFTEISSQLAPDKVANMLNRLYLKFDDLSRRFAVFKVETIGDSVRLTLRLCSHREFSTIFVISVDGGHQLDREAI